MSQRVQLYDQAEKLKAEGKLDEAAEVLQRLVEEAPDYALAHSALAVIQQRLGQHEEAIQHALRVTELEPHDAFSFTALSVTYQRAYAGTNEHQYIRLAEEAMERSRMLGSRH